MKKKNLNAKKITPNSFNFKEILKDKKIFETYKVFERNIENFKNSKKIAISISGGPDSMALCFLISCYISKRDKSIER